jgi:phytol kinase
MLTLGYGDGLAAVIGKRFGKTFLIKGKSVEGSLVMFIATAFVTAFVLITYAPAIAYPAILVLILPFIATAIEMFTPKGLDNLTIPLGIGLITYLYTILFTLV